MVLVALEMIVGCVASIWFIIITFKVSFLWGIASLIISGVSLFFTISHWNEAKDAILVVFLICTPIIFWEFVGGE